MVWQPQTPAAYAGMKRLGITGGAVIANRDDPGADVAARTAGLKQAGLRWYVENIATDFYAPYHRFLPGRPVNALFLNAQQRWRENPADASVFFRTPSLSDAAWIARIRARLQQTVNAHGPGRPLFYDLGDETGIADLTAAWDFDRSPVSLAAMQVWLAGRYGSLYALNAQWGTAFARWEDVVPMTTPEALRRSDDNFSSWSDFKEWMDEAFSRALRAGTDAVHAADPTALAAIEGAQRPGPGGYDYTRLARAVDVMEIYPDEDNLDIVQSLNPGVVLLTTSANDDPVPHRAVWQALLRGSRGLVLWDDAHDIVLPDGTTGQRGHLAAPLLAELHGPAVAAWLASTPDYDPVAILYSPESDRVQWLLDRRAEGGSWSERDADIENQDNAVRASRRRMSTELLHRGIRPRWVAPEQVALESGLPPATRVLMLPQTIALSDAAIAGIRRFSAGGGLVFADGPPGRFDGHGRRRAALPVIEGIGNAIWPDDWLRRFAAAGVVPRVTITHGMGADAPNDIALWIARRGDRRVIGMLRDLPATGRAEGPPDVELDLGHGGEVRDLRRNASLGFHTRLRVNLDPMAPTFVEITIPN